MDANFIELNRETIKKIYKIDDEAVGMLSFEADRHNDQSQISKHPFIFHTLLSIITFFLYPLKGLKQRVETGSEDFVFVSCPDPVFRTESIRLIAQDLKYSIIYLPNFHVSSAIQYNKYFKKCGVNVFFPTIKLKYVFAAWKKTHKLKNISEIVGGEKKNRNISLGVLTRYAIYDQVVKDYLTGMRYFNGKWLLEHDKFYFLAPVINLHQLGKKCTMLQHGIFFRPSFNFIPLYCDNVLCCSTREKSIYIENGVAEDRIEVFGAPLQTLRQSENKNGRGKHYDLLVIMTCVTINEDLIREVLTHIKQNYQSVLVRMRPRSHKTDEACLAKELNGMIVSAPGTPIEEDISCCDKVVSFSEDANVEIAKMNKPFIVVWTDEKSNPKSMGKCATKENYAEEIANLMSKDFYSTFSKEQYKDILGETDINVLREKFVDFIQK